MSISAEPLNEPRSEIWIMRESIVASTEPSTTSVSQSVISTPFSLMFGPTVSLLSPSLPAVLAAAAVGATVAATMFEAPAAAAALGLVPGARMFGLLSSRLLKKGDCNAMVTSSDVALKRAADATDDPWGRKAELRNGSNRIRAVVHALSHVAATFF